MLDARLGAHQVFRNDVARKRVGLRLGGQVRVRVGAHALLRGPAFGRGHNRVSLRQVVLVLLRRIAADEFGLQVEGVGVREPDLRQADVAVVDENMRQRRRHRPIQHRRTHDAVGGLQVLVDFDVVLDQIAVFRKVDAVTEDLCVVVVKDGIVLLLPHRILLAIVGRGVSRLLFLLGPLFFLLLFLPRILFFVFRCVLVPRIRSMPQPFTGKPLQTFLLALVGRLAPRRHARNVALQRVRNTLRILKESLALVKGSLCGQLVHVANMLVHGLGPQVLGIRGGGGGGGQEAALRRGNASRQPIVDGINGPRKDAQRNDFGHEVTARNLAQPPRHKP